MDEKEFRERLKEYLTFFIPNQNNANTQLLNLEAVATQGFQRFSAEVEVFNSSQNDFFYNSKKMQLSAPEYGKLHAALAIILGDLSMPDDYIDGENLRKIGAPNIYDRFIFQDCIARHSSEYLGGLMLNNQRPGKPTDAPGFDLSIETAKLLLEPKILNYEIIDEFGMELAKYEEFSLAVDILKYLRKQFPMPVLRVDYIPASKYNKIVPKMIARMESEKK